MEPKQKAEELVEKFIKYAHLPFRSMSEPQFKEKTKNAIQCAIICVEEILEELPDMVHGKTWEGQVILYDNFRKLYWQSVLTELKAMV